MPTPNKPVAVLRTEKRSHRTKKELELREKGEAELTSGEPLKVRQEVRDSKIAYAEFKRVNKLLKLIGKNDALVEGAINRYCEITAEIIEFEAKREEFSKGITQLEAAYEEDMEAHPSFYDRTIRSIDYFKTLAAMESAMLSLDKRIMDKRKMLLDIEKENVMTIAAQLRSIPKKVEDEAETDAMAALFNARAGARGA